VTTERVDDQVKPAQRIAGPAGFLLVLLVFLLLPGVAASCSVAESQEGAGSISADANGADLVLGGDPYFEAEGAFEMPPTLHASTVEQGKPEEPVRFFASAAVVFMVLGLATMFVLVWRLRAVVTLVVAVVAAACLAVAEILVVQQWVRQAEEWGADMVYLPDAQGQDMVGLAGDIVHPAYGFWLTLAGLLAIAAPNLVLLIRHRKRAG
jgi:hypothetical protein